MKQLSLPFLCTVVLFLLFLTPDRIAAQNPHLDLNIAHNWNYLDRDIELSVEKFGHKLGVKVGVNYFQHTIIDAPNWEKAYATNFAQHLGIHAAVLYRIALKDSNVELSPFFKISAFHIGERYQTDYETFQQRPAGFKSNTSLGFQVKTKLSGRLFMLASAEAGARWYEASSLYITRSSIVFNGISTGGSVGLAWRFKKKGA